MAETFHIVRSERCRFLTHKEMFYEVEHDASSASHRGSPLYWCAQTQNALGPDGQMVDDRQCHPGRTCYREV